MTMRIPAGCRRKINYAMRDITRMVLPLVDEDKPKCFLCHDGFQDIEALRDHQKSKHRDFFDFHKDAEKGPAPGDVSIF